MKESEGAKHAAVELDSKEMNGRRLTVNVNPDKPEATPQIAPQTPERIVTPPAKAIRISPRIDRTATERPKHPRRTSI
ncbi:hypothetical protein D0C36_15845 [Mucilaginibacter conchicola]|uniref:RNA-binding protein n=1 Tax=Mucilaginibacter conchicola TaxID=2303333 RepID=A0A372NUB5_9SPHI|nr:hypothetical protein [Mucilaginibacter conchicola]RFZ92863.1 hypothetical protein D0C36_15845 [Mucilaginibacter conchicola]